MFIVDHRVNSVLAAVLSSSIAPIHGALAQEETTTEKEAGLKRTAIRPEKGKLSRSRIEPVSSELEDGYSGA